MLHLPEKYQERRISASKPTWRWAEALKGLFPTTCADIDMQTTYRGHTLMCESKPWNATIPNWQRAHLMSLAKDRKHWVIIVGVRYETNEIVWWSWVDKDRWPFGRHRQLGGYADFREEIESWRKTIDIMEDANATYWTCYRMLRAMCKRPWKPLTDSPDALTEI